ncbi:hypothetical protein BBJ28_00017318, partial [Nothophytophthora sp. Chile5]
MASNELAAILARRRAKEGGGSAPPAPAIEKSSDSSPAPAPSAPRSSIAERIARLKQQSAAASPAPPTPAPMRFERPTPSTVVWETPASEPENLQASSSSVGSASESSATSAPEPVDTSAVAAAQDAAGIRRASSKIQQLQGSLGINVNPFGRPGGPTYVTNEAEATMGASWMKECLLNQCFVCVLLSCWTSGGYRKPVSAHRESIMSTGEEQYAYNQHAMGVAMPGMSGSAIPMPGLAKAGMRFPGMAPDGAHDAEASAAALDDSHTTMARVAGPKRRGPARPPPGAFRIPMYTLLVGQTMAAPIVDDVEPTHAPAFEPAAVEVSASSSPLFPSEEPSPAPAAAVAVPTEPIEVETPEAPAVISSPAPVAGTLFGNPTVSPPTPAPAPVAIASPPVAVKKAPEAVLMPAPKPYVVEDSFTPVYDPPVYSDAPAGFPSVFSANFSMDELTIED